MPDKLRLSLGDDPPRAILSTVFEAQRRWERQTREALQAIAKDAKALGDALGTISLEEAVDGLKQAAVAAIDKVGR